VKQNVEKRLTLAIQGQYKIYSVYWPTSLPFAISGASLICKLLKAYIKN
jgi:hypothetical protein